MERACTAWAMRKDVLRPHEKKMYDEALAEIERVEAELDAMTEPEMVEAEETEPEPGSRPSRTHV